MKKILAIAGIAICCAASATTETNKLPLPDDQQGNTVTDQWGIEALNFPKQSSIHSAELLGLTSLGNLADITVEQPVNTVKNHEWINSLSNQSVYRLGSTQSSSLGKTISGINAGFSKGKFSAQTGMYSDSADITDSGHFYLQGAYRLFESERFHLSVTAKLEALDENSINHFSGNVNQITGDSTLFDQVATNTTIGLFSSYSINRNWKVHGIISSTSLDNKIEASPLIDSNNVHMALIGTSYSF